MGSLCGVQDSGFEGRVYCLGFRVVFKGVWDWVGFEQRRGFDYRILYGPLIYIYGSRRDSDSVFYKGSTQFFIILRPSMRGNYHLGL